MNSSADEIVSALLEDGQTCEIDPAVRAEVAQRLFIHGLLVERHRRGSLEALVLRDVRKTLPRGRRLRGLAAAAVLVGIFGLVVFRGKSLPSAEATVTRALQVLEMPVDRHYIDRVYLAESNEPAPIGPLHWYVRADRWVVRAEPFGRTQWLLGDAKRIWWVNPKGLAIELPPGITNLVVKDLDPTLLHSNLTGVIRQMRTGFTLSTVGREVVGGRRVVHVRGIRTSGTFGLKQVDLWAEEESGMTLRAELILELLAPGTRKHVLEYVDSEPQNEKFYLPSGHTK